jgi:hypothetical protein
MHWALLGAALLLLDVAAVTGRAQAPSAQVAASARVIDYNWDVRPILSEYCFRCHGPDEKARRANLRLDQADSAYAALAGGRGERHAVVPGKPDESEMIRRVTHQTPALRMPPAVTNKVVSAEQIETLRLWIAQGAQYKPHWAYITPVKPAVPSVKAAGRGLTDVDRFVVSRLEREGLALSAQADKETLINRVSLGLTGLPPTLAEVDAFLKDSSPSAYEKVVDRLLASPAYGERMAGYWLDVARYSESDGFLDDRHDRLFWPYRDWVIAAFNRNMPFDQFATWQLAGDLMPSHTKEQKLATAFLRVGKRTTENGSIDEEYRVEYVVDRTNTIGTAFLGLTVGCARCHDHKYDPISHKDFYSLSGFFNSTDEPGFYAPGNTGITPGPTINWTDAATEAKLAQADALVKERETAFDAARAAAARDAAIEAERLAGTPDAAATVQRSIAASLAAHYAFEQTSPIPDDQLPTSRPRRRMSPPVLEPLTQERNPFGPPPQPPANAAGQNLPPSGDQQLAAVRQRRNLPSDLVRDALVFTPSEIAGVPPGFLEAPIFKDGVKGKAFYFDDTNRGVLGADVGNYERHQPFSLDFWLLAAQEYEDSAVLNNLENDNNGNAGYALKLEKNRLRFDVMHSRAGDRISVVSRVAVPVKKWTHVTVTYDGSSRARGVALYLDGARLEVDVVSDNLTRTIIPNGGGTLGDEYLGLQFGKRFRMTTLKDGAIDEIRVFKKALAPIEIRTLQDAGAAFSDRDTVRRDLVEVLVAGDARVVEAAARLAEARDAQNRIVSVLPQVMVMGDTPTPRPTYVLLRGQYTDHGEQVQPRGLSQIFPWNDGLPKNRLGLASWLFDPKNPLTSRVFVNRVWQLYFGQGLVGTSEDFGSQGSIPSHPELLDWLAVTFRESGWDIKGLHKRIVMSATYRQSSNVSDELLKRDPRNVLLARAPRMRMPAEMVRDNALAASGLLVRTVGGKSTYPYQPDTIWDGTAGATYPDASRIPADDHHRRTLYSFVKRNAPHPAMATFDLPDRGTSVVRRQTSNTPLQALVLLDDPQYLEAYRVLAAHVLRTVQARDARLTMVFRLATRRHPQPVEMDTMRRYYDSQVQRYTSDQDAAAELLSVGVTPVDTKLPAPELAAMMNLATVVMNTPDAYSLR